jgi:hypothetical protein
MTMIEQVRQKLSEAMQTGEVLRILYHGGSNPGAMREIIPLQLSVDKVRARCYTSRAVKEFVLSKIELRDFSTDKEDTKIRWDLGMANPILTLQTVSEVHSQLMTHLASAGWHVTLSEEENLHQLGLHRLLKNGKPKKHPDVALAYKPLAYEYAFSGNEFVPVSSRPNTRPWSVQATGANYGGPWSKPDKAIAKFMEASGLVAAP